MPASVVQYSCNSAFLPTDTGLAFLTNIYDYSTGQSSRKLLFVDLSQPTKPTVTEQNLINSSDLQFFGLVPDATDTGALYLSYRAEVTAVAVSRRGAGRAIWARALRSVRLAILALQ